MCFMVGVRVMFCVVVGPVFGFSIPVVSKLSCDARQRSHQKRISIILLLRGTIVLLTTPEAVELSIWIGLLGWGQPMSMRVWRWGIISHAVMNRAASSASAADAITNLMIWAMESTAPLKRGNGSFSERKM